MHKRFGKSDVILITATLVIAIVALLVTKKFFMSGGDEVLITIDGETFGEYSLLTEQTIDITDSEGKTINKLKISGGKANMIWADCPDKLCVKHNEISKENESIICLPNKVIATITKSSGGVSDIDSVSK